MASLDGQARVHEIPTRTDRIAAIAREHAQAAGSTLVISPDNRSRREINEQIHTELQAQGKVNQHEHQMTTLVSR